MNSSDTPSQRLSNATGSRCLTFTSCRKVIGICLAACVLTALASLLLGQDANWDLRNYHLYNGWAALHGRLAIDLAPSQLQSYFVPWLDAGYYLLAIRGSALLAGAVLGAWHGLAFATVAAVAWLALAGDPRRVWLAPLLALAGCLCSAVFISELGTTMGDDTTAPLVLGALALALLAARTDNARSARHWLLAGVLLGLALAFKLTNAPYALGLGVAALVAGGGWPRRLRGAALMTLAALAVFALIAGPWFWQVYQQFGNPLFPQMNQWFHAPLVVPAPNNDATWLPKNTAQMLAWPLLISVKPIYMCEPLLYQSLWGVLYLLAAFAIIRAAIQTLLRRTGRHPAAGLPSPNPVAARMLAAFVVVAFLAWMAAFSIHRYLIALELVAPLALWLLARRTFAAVSAEKWATVLIALCAFIGCGSTVKGVTRDFWDHAAWSSQGFSIQAPPMPQPSTATVLLVGGDPQAWRVPLLPPQAAYVNVSGFFPGSSGYEARTRQIAADRGGAVYAMFPGALPNAPCKCSLNHYVNQPDQQNQQLMQNYEAQLRAHGWLLKPDSCTVLPSAIGKRNYPFHWCEVTPLPITAP